MSEVEAAAAPAVSEGNASASIPQAVQVVEPAKKSMEETMAEAYDKINPPRDQQQRFAAKEPAKEPAAEPEAPAETTETEGQAPTEETAEPAKPAISYPTSLPAELREKLDQAAPELRDWVAKREAESHKRITELGQAAKASEPIRQIGDRYKASFKGMGTAEAFEKLAAANEFLERDPVAGIQWLADAYGVQLSSLGKPSPEGAEGNSEVAQLRQTISQLQRQMAETSNKVTSREQREQQSNQKSIEKTVEDFAKDKPYWAEIEADVASQVHAILATDNELAPDKILERAYDRALKLNEGVQAKLQADKKAEADKKAKAEAAKKAADAKKSASVNVKSGQGASPKPSGSWEQTMREVADRLMG